MRHRTMAEAALERLREAIILGELTPGTPLRLEDLASSLGTSISPVREAVRRARGAGARGAHPPPRREGHRARRRGAARALLRPARPRDARRTTRRGALHRRGRGRRARAARGVRRRSARRRRARGGAGAHGVPLRALRGGAVRLAAAPDSAGVGQLRSLPAGAARGDGRSAEATCGARCRPPGGVRRARSRPKAGAALRDHLELATAIFSVELAGRSIFAF